MARKLDPKITATLKEFGFDHTAAWDCHGVWVVYHKVLEQIAAKAGIKFSQPTIIEANGKEKIAAVCVTGTYKDRDEWSIGEAAPGNNKNAYPWAMAEKRAKDRVILKLLQLHGIAYSEEEADDFKQRLDQEADHRTPEAILNDFLERARNIPVGERKEFEQAWKEELPDLSKVQRNCPEIYNTFKSELHKVLHERRLDHMGGSEDAPKTAGKQEPDASGGDTVSKQKAMEMWAAWKESPHITGLETSMKQAGFLTVGEDGWVVKPDSPLGVIRENDRAAFDVLSANTDKLRVKMSKGKAA